MTLCTGCAQAVQLNAEYEAAGEIRRRHHFCYRTNGFEEVCSCSTCHPLGSFMMAGKVKLHTDLEFDLAGLIRDNRDRYLSVELNNDPEWYRPIQFLYEVLEEEGSENSFFGEHLRVQGDDFDFHERGKWTIKQFELLSQACPQARPDWRPPDEPPKPEIPGQMPLEPPE